MTPLTPEDFAVVEVGTAIGVLVGTVGWFTFWVVRWWCKRPARAKR